MLWIKLLTWFKGERVGEDNFGNRYYRQKRLENGQERRWVIYKGLPEASKVPAEWHGWLHYIEKDPPTLKTLEKWSWEKKHLPNLTGTPYAYYPPGHFFAGGKRDSATGDYEAWSPQEDMK